MANINTSLYPPQINTWMPAFDTNECSVLFSISQYNSLADIKYAQITVKYQSSNLSALDETKYPNGIKVVPVADFTSYQRILVKAEDLRNGIFKLNEYYKVQIRFVSSSASDWSKATEGTWLNTNKQYFSEWSSICLIRKISTITATSTAGFVFNASQLTTYQKPSIADNMLIAFEDENETEKLRSYQITLQSSDETVIYDSGTVIVNNSSYNINYKINQTLDNGDIYYLKVKIITFDYCEKTFGQKIRYLGAPAIRDVDINCFILDSEDGRIGLDFSKISERVSLKNKNFIIKRADETTNFLDWKEMRIVSFVTNYNYIWYDSTVESGVRYKYGIQEISSTMIEGTLTMFHNPVLILLDSIFINKDKRQLKIKFNPKVTSVKHNVSESLTKTLGSKFPYVSRNTLSKYRSFQISGIISYQADDNNIYYTFGDFIKEGEINTLFGEDNSIATNKTSLSKADVDFLKEKIFRENVIDFLYKEKACLIRTSAEGNLLCYLMDINFTPQNSLGNKIYEFSANAIEIDENTVENLVDYEIIDTSEYSLITKDTEVEIGGTIEGLDNLCEGDILSQEADPSTSSVKYIKDTCAIYKDNYKVYKDYRMKNAKINYLSFTFQGKPLPISTEGEIVKPKEGSEIVENFTYYGYVLYIGDTKIIVPAIRAGIAPDGYGDEEKEKRYFGYNTDYYGEYVLGQDNLVIESI